MPKKADARTEVALPLRIVFAAPPPGIMFCVQGKPGEYLCRQRSTTANLVFDVEVRVTDSDPPRLLGNVAQGSPAVRFLYVCAGTYAGDANTHWARRAKVPLTGITREMIANAKPGARLTAVIAGTGRDGGPVCASVKLSGAGWKWTMSS